MNKVAIVGAAGRMGGRLIANIMADERFELSGALEHPSCPKLGADAGVNAGCGPAGVTITADLEEALKGADSVIIFSTGSAIDMVRAAVEKNVAVVLGTTALPAEERAAIAELGKKGRIVFASNMSVGVNLLCKLAAEAARILGLDYDVEIVEMHHNQKKDAPSGTAVTLAETVAAELGLDYEKDTRHGRQGLVGARTRKEIGMHSLRGGDVVGDHTVIFAAEGERIELTHKASSRDTFVHGALRAAEYLKDAPNGLYDMRDVLGFK